MFYRRSPSTSSSESSEEEESDASEASQRESSAGSTPGERPPVLDKPPHVCLHRFLLPDLLERQIHGPRAPRTRGPDFSARRVGSHALTRRLELSYKLAYHEGCVNSLHFNPSGSLLASGSDDLEIAVWHWERRRKAFSFHSGHRANVFQSKFLYFTGDTHLISASRDGQVRLAELSAAGECRRTKRVAQHKAAVHSLTLMERSPHVVLSAGEDSVVACIDVREADASSNLITQTENGKKVPIYSIDSHPKDDNIFCTSGRDQYVRIYDRRNISPIRHDPVKKFCPHHLVSGRKKSL